MATLGEIVRGRRGTLGATLLAGAALLGSGETNLQQTNTLVWTLVAISAAGSIVTFGFLVYALVKFRDPKMRGRRYG
ncbi:MAG: hypothetical protein ABSB97_05840 [Thermoplasmata archaeon]|jgi:heme/copper-type cytochrome/quinol oxidase subunit 2